MLRALTDDPETIRLCQSELRDMNGDDDERILMYSLASVPTAGAAIERQRAKTENAGDGSGDCRHPIPLDRSPLGRFPKASSLLSSLPPSSPHPIPYTLDAGERPWRST